MRWLPAVLFLALCSTCDHVTDPTPTPQPLPWLASSFIHPETTEISFVNASDSAWAVGSDLRDYYIIFNELLPDSLHSGETVTLKADIFYPRRLYVFTSHYSTLRPVLPGHSRTLRYDGKKLTEAGKYQAIYNYLDSALLVLHPEPFYPTKFSDLWAYHDTLTAEFTLHLDTLSTTSEIPTWTIDLARREAYLMSLERPLYARTYRQYFYGDSVAVPPAYIDTVRSALELPLAYQSASYDLLFGSYARFLVEAEVHPDESAATRNYWSYANVLLHDFPAPSYRIDATAEFLSARITEQIMYRDKAQIIDTLIASLPSVYQASISAITEQVAARYSSSEGMQDFLVTPLESGSGRSVTPINIRRQPTTLYKFWFAGCTPCIKEQPYERDLLAQYPELEIVYVAFNTSKDNWLPYLDKHNAPASNNLYVPEGRNDLVQAALGQAGAPIYVLLDKNNRVRCRNCPKPSDPSLASLLNEL